MIAQAINHKPSKASMNFPGRSFSSVQAKIAVILVGALFLIAFPASALTPLQVAKLLADDSASEDEFGGSVAVSGSTVVVGAGYHDYLGADRGSAYVFSILRSNLVSLADLNSNGSQEVPVLVEGGSTHVHIRDGNTGVLINDIDFGIDPITAMAAINDISGNGMPEISLAQGKTS